LTNAANVYYSIESQSSWRKKMPIYEYGCVKCGKTHEIMQKFSDAPLAVCPDCGGEVRKLISNTSFVLKGTGWYATDYASSKTAGEGKINKTSETKAGASGNEQKTEPAPEAKSETKKEEVAAK
jgi:putative FmdB family regulatory protein